MPGSIYIGHVTVEKGDSDTISQEIIHYFAKQSIPMKDITFVGCDGCVGNAGRERGVIA